MVEPISLGVIVAALIAKLLARGEDATVDAGVEGTRRLLSILKRRSQPEADDAIGRALPALQEAPDSPKRVQALADAIDEAAVRNDDVRSELESVVAELRQAGVTVEAVTQTAQGNQNVQVSGLQGSTLNVRFGTDSSS